MTIYHEETVFTSFVSWSLYHVHGDKCVIEMLNIRIHNYDKYILNITLPGVMQGDWFWKPAGSDWDRWIGRKWPPVIKQTSFSSGSQQKGIQASDPRTYPNSFWSQSTRASIDLWMSGDVFVGRGWNEWWTFRHFLQFVVVIHISKTVGMRTINEGRCTSRVMPSSSKLLIARSEMWLQGLWLQRWIVILNQPSVMEVLADVVNLSVSCWTHSWMSTFSSSGCVL